MRYELSKIERVRMRQPVAKSPVAARPAPPAAKASAAPIEAHTNAPSSGWRVRTNRASKALAAAAVANSEIWGNPVQISHGPLKKTAWNKAEPGAGNGLQITARNTASTNNKRSFDPHATSV